MGLAENSRLKSKAAHAGVVSEPHGIRHRRLDGTGDGGRSSSFGPGPSWKVYAPSQID